MFKRIISVISAIAVISCLSLSSAAVDDNRDFSYDAEILTILGVLEQAPDSTVLSAGVTRAQAAWLIERILKPQSSEAGTAAVLFDDVEENHPYISSIAFVYSMGIMNGTGGDKFAPDDLVSYRDFLKILITVLGYSARAERMGGYPTGYYYAASELKLTNGIYADFDQPINMGAVCRLLNAALETDIMEQVSFGSEEKKIVISGKNLLSSRLKIAFAYGKVTGTEVSMLSSNDKCADGFIQIDRIMFKNSAVDYADLLGLSVKYYYKFYDSAPEDNEVIHIEERVGRNAELRIDSGDIDGFSENTYTYTINGKQKKQSISKNTDIIYNDVYAGNITDAEFVPSDGYARLIDTNGTGDYDLVLITDLKTLVVRSYSPLENIAYDKYDSSLTVNMYDTSKTVILTDGSGNPVKAANLRENDVLTIAESLDGKYIKAIFSKNTVSGTISETVMSGGRDDCLVISGEKYYFTKKLIDNQYENLTMDREVKVHLDYRGKVAAISLGAFDSSFGYLASAMLGKSVDKELNFLIYTQKGEMKQYKAEKNIELDGVIFKNTDLALDYFYVINDIGTKLFRSDLINYKTNGAGNIIKIDTAVYNAGSENEESLTKTFSGYGNDINNTAAYKKGTTSLVYKSNPRIFGGQVAIRDDTIVFVVPQADNETDSEKYSLRPLSYFGNDGSYYVDAYRINSGYGASKALVMYDAVVEDIGKNSQVGIVEAVTSAYDEETEEIARRLYVYSSGRQQLWIKNTCDFPDVKEGDVIYYNLDGLGKIAKAQLVYDRAADVMAMGNPTGALHDGARLRSVFGRIYSKEDNYIAVTTANLTGLTTPLPLSDVEIHRLDNFQIYVYDSRKMSSKISSGGGNDLVSFEQAPGDCSKVLVCTRLGDPRAIFIYR